MRTKGLSTAIVGAAAVLLAGCTSTAPSGENAGSAGCPTATLGTLDDDATRAAYYAISNGIVKSDVVPAVEITYLSIPAAGQAMGTGQFTYLNAGLPGLLFAREAGLDARSVGWILGHTGGGIAIYARAGSGIETPKDLVGKRVSIASLVSTSAIAAQIVLTQKYGMNANMEGGDFSWVELDPPTQLNALESGDIDAAILWHQSGFIARNDPQFVNVAQLDAEYREVSDGNWPIGAMVTVQGEYAEQYPECVSEFQRMQTESVAYAQEHYREIAPAIAEETGVSVDFINYWWQPDHYQFGGVIDDTWNGYAEALYSLAFDGGFLPQAPDLQSIIVEPKS